MSADYCVCCGDIIPEGRQVCRKCELNGYKPYVVAYITDNINLYSDTITMNYNPITAKGINKIINVLKNRHDSKNCVILNIIELHED